MERGRSPITQQLRVAARKKKRRKNISLVIGIIVGLELCLHQMACHTMSVHALMRPQCVVQHHSRCAFLGRQQQFASKWGSSRIRNHHSKLMFIQPINSNWKPINKYNNICFHTRHHSTTITRLQADLSTINESNWQSFSNELEETLELPSISVPAKHIHWLLSNKDSPIKSFLAHTMDEFEGIHPKIKVVRNLDQDDDDDQVRKRILLSSTELIPDDTFQLLQEKYHARMEDTFNICIPHHQQPVTRILSKILPEEAQPPPSSYEQVGHVVHVNLKAQHVDYGKIIGSILLDRLQPTTKTVVNKLGEVGGPFRTYQMGLLAGEDDYFVHVVEHGVSLYFDLRKVYWCTRLEGERTYMLKNEFQPNQIIADAFCGCGAQLIRAASKKGCRIVANDLNPDAVEYCKESARKNGIDVSPGNFDVQCGDAREFIMNLGMRMSESSSTTPASDTTINAFKLPHHLLLNFPLDSPSFLNALRWWPSGEVMDPPPRIHVYTFARGDEDRTEAEVAIDMVADGLLPEGGYSIASKFRGDYLNELGCNVEAREIRDAAPGKLVICVSFSASRTLLRRMQGDFFD
eukprot:CAMPEP_0113429998 /NCGR_PEP_ID=MMETSP0013_2-20120614/32761_1 /TAXON_ID=2843 ORGANISM="Skeletonema costatum, Strain 1716" /NCGR_SAMPLE_ID=MMETSP0013_2 /ASSEMBLY_ACC=CAM_ASM_000158 /LENGTH=575 /DNA_ID=CAMNT_0000318783 /DNA_START=29 /DNA_END=1756 /DNA_ORIENTATION=- /assembly_acc=CAM_ASM_000158